MKTLIEKYFITLFFLQKVKTTAASQRYAGQIRGASTLILALFCTTMSWAQEAYFQQTVAYDIEVSLDDKTHELKGIIDIDYTNNSPDELAEIYMHLWGNAYKNQQTAFAKQQIQHRDPSFYFAEEQQLGYYKALDFSVDGQQVSWRLDKKHIDIAILTLEKPLQPGEKIQISTPFTLKLPASFSRLGHVNQSYQITQWYPKPAVYDQKGWHPMPYLNLGEFYSEFGDFEVKITLPENYVVGATGILQTPSEKAFLEEKIKTSAGQLSTGMEKTDKQLNQKLMLLDTFPPSSTKLKTIRFTASQVHDFAWFADKRFLVQRGQTALPSGKKVEIWTMFTHAEKHLWAEALTYLDRSLKYYSERVGEYPYPQATAVHSQLSKGGGMEYPMITLIGAEGSAESLDAVITHEVGHNWFYGVLASNERDHAWMDEGLNAYYEEAYLKQYYLAEQETLGNQAGSSDVLDLLSAPNRYRSLARLNFDVAPDAPVEEMSSVNYFVASYDKPVMMLNMLEAYLGRAKFDQAMRRYYETWQFKHPQPKDLRQVLEAETGEDLAWFFEDLIQTNKEIDYKLKTVKANEGWQLTVENKAEINAPFSVSGMKDGELIQTKWYKGFSGIQDIDFGEGDYDLIGVNIDQEMPEVNQADNVRKTSGLLKSVASIAPQFIYRTDNPLKSEFNIMPLFAWNNYDKFMLGALFHNKGDVEKRFEYGIAPLYSFVTKDVLGTAHLKYNFFPESNSIDRISLALKGKSFHNNYNPRFDYDLKYYRLAPSLTVVLGAGGNSNTVHTIQAKSILLSTENPELSFVDGQVVYDGNELEQTMINRLTYKLENYRLINPYGLMLSLEHQAYERLAISSESYLKASLELKTSYLYQTDKYIDIRVFVGGYLNNTRDTTNTYFNELTRGSYSTTAQGFTDYGYDDFYFGRSEQEDIWSQQVSIRDGGLKNAFGGAFNIGLSNQLVLSLNMKADLPVNLPFGLPLKPYFDIAYFKKFKEAELTNQLVYSGGVMLEFWKESVGIYVPIFNSENLRDLYDTRANGNFLARISFSVDLLKLSPFDRDDQLLNIKCCSF